MTKTHTSNSLTWDQVEKQIIKEAQWLENVIDRYSKKEKDHTGNPVCPNCILRKLALMIIHGDVAAVEINKDPKLQNFWLKSDTKTQRKIYHGSNWHRKTMEKIEAHFKLLECDVVLEPDLNYGRADLGIYKKGEKDLLIEVGTIQLYKLWFNLNRMAKNVIYLIIPNDKKMIEFTKTN